MLIDIKNKLFKKIPYSTLDDFEKFQITHPFKQIIVKDDKWNYIISGISSETLLILPGGLRNPIFSYSLISELEKYFTIISPAYPLLCSMDDLLQGIISILKKEDIVKSNIFGSSFGGMVAQYLLYKLPEIVNKVILSNTGTIIGNKEKSKQIISSLYTGINRIKKVPGKILRVISYRRLSRLAEGSKGEVNFFKQLLKYFIQTKILGKQELICHFKSLLDFHQNYVILSNQQKQLVNNLLIIQSDNDIGVSPELSNELKHIYPKAQFFKFTDAGHMPMFSKREEYLNLIIDFIKN